ncbi:YetF domain-containing protein [Emcibacter sp. SYSU 3D8]|uniref:DUF421 domain-containing protein n=1 Tax=Emcibacter sp. SYSU 3D8 TaxID=3133969 RepID=UPI0031FEEF7D
MTPDIFFNSWSGLGRALLIGVLAYAGLIVLLRISGKRTLSKMNAFDLVVTVALGSTLASVLLDRSVPLAEGLLAFALLIVLQFVITWMSVRNRWFRGMIKSEPSLLVRDGAYLPGAMRRQRVTREEIEAALRKHGHDDIAKVAAVVLETDGALSVIPSRSS